MKFTTISPLPFNPELSPPVQQEAKKLNLAFQKLQRERQALTTLLTTDDVDTVPKKYRALLTNELELRQELQVWYGKALSDVNQAIAHQQVVVRDLTDNLMEQLQGLGFKDTAIAKQHPSVIAGNREGVALISFQKSIKREMASNTGYILEVKSSIRGFAQQIVSSLTEASRYRPAPPLGSIMCP